MFESKKPIEVLDFRAFAEGVCIVKNQAEIDAWYTREAKKRLLYKTVIRVGCLTLVIMTAMPIHPKAIEAATTLAEVAVNGKDNGWDKLVGGLLGLLDPAAKIFGVIAGLAIMTGNGKIGLERLFWLSLGYITARKVDDWINFLSRF